MATEQGNALVQAFQYGGGGLALAALGAFARGLWTGTNGQEKELRMEYREEMTRLRGVQEAQQGEIDELRENIRALTTMNLHLLTSRADARAELRALQQQHGVAVTVWPPDPPTTPGGTP